MKDAVRESAKSLYQNQIKPESIHASGLGSFVCAEKDIIEQFKDRNDCDSAIIGLMAKALEHARGISYLDAVYEISGLPKKERELLIDKMRSGEFS